MLVVEEIGYSQTKVLEILVRPLVTLGVQSVQICLRLQGQEPLGNGKACFRAEVGSISDIYKNQSSHPTSLMACRGKKTGLRAEKSWILDEHLQV